MAKVSYGQMPGIKAVLDSWWNTKGLPWSFLQQLDTAAQVIATNIETFEKMRQKFIKEYAKMDSNGKPVTDEDDAVVFDDPERANAEWANLLAVEFDCPTLGADDLNSSSDKLGITLGIMRVLKPIIA